MKSDLKWELVCYHCLLLSFHTACDGTRVHHCLILTLDLILTSVSCHANDHKSVNKENVTVSHHKNRIFINRGGKTGKTDRIFEWYQHSKEVNKSAVRWQHGASIGRLAAEKTHPFLLEGWGCRQKAGTSPTVKCPYLAVSDEAFRSYLSHTLLWWAACMHTHRHTDTQPPCHWFYNSYHLVCGIFPNSNLTASPWPRADLWKKYSKNGFNMDLFDRKYQEWFHNWIHNEERRKHTDLSLFWINQIIVTKRTLIYLNVAITSH